MLKRVKPASGADAEAAEITMLATTGCLGYGFSETAFWKGVEQGLDFIGCDAGSMDPGPYYLGAGIPFTSRQSAKRDMALMLEAAVRDGIPLLIGSCGGGGGRPHVEFTRDMVLEIAREKGLHFKMALINAEVEQDYLLAKVRAGKVKPLGPIGDLTEQDVRDTHRVVAMMGVEPYHAALKAGAQVILAGRSSDAAIFAAIPTMRGADPALAWHLGKIIECGGAVVEPKIGQDCVIGRLRSDHFIVEPGHPDKKCPRIRVAAHTLYENPSPYHLVEPTGTLDTTGSTYEQINPRAVKVAGSKMSHAPVYTVKLEGVKRLGFRTMFIAGIRDPGLIKELDTYIATNTAKVAEDAAGLGIAESDYRLTFRVYGKNAVMGSLEPVKETQAHEVGLLVDCIAKDEETSKVMLAKARYCCLHNDFPNRMCISGNLAFPFSPSDVSVGWVYSFHIWHVMELEDPLEPFAIELVEV